MTRTPVFAANWKMHKTVREAVNFTEVFLPQIASVTNVVIVIAPPFTALAAVSSACRGSNVVTSAQNVHEESHGAFTGELSVDMLKEAGASHVIIGHSERRHLYGETDAVINFKIQASLDVGLRPIVCIGETLEERETERTHAVLANQLTKGLKGLSEEAVASLRRYRHEKPTKHLASKNQPVILNDYVEHTALWRLRGGLPPVACSRPTSTR